MNRSAKILLAVATLWPVMYMFIFFAFILSQVLSGVVGGGSPSGDGMPVAFAVIFVLHMLTIFWMFGLEIIYIINVFKNDRVEKDKKVLWAVVLFLGNMIAMPIYWYLYIWRDPTEESTGTSSNSP